MPNPRTNLPIVTLLLTMTATLPGCGSAYYSMMESMGWEKRDLLVDNVTEARDEQEKAKEQFADALEQFKSVVDVDGGDLEKKYDKLNAEYRASVKRANAVNKRIGDIEHVADALFDEWNDELDQYTDQNLRRASENQLRDTERSYDRMIDAMKRAEDSMQPVLDAFADQVLFLKHNLNAKAIASIQDSATALEGDIETLIAEMQASIDEANEFIESMGATDK